MKRNVAENHNSRAKDLRVLNQDRLHITYYILVYCRLHNGEDWSRKAKIVENHKSDRSHLLETDKGTTNRRHMMPMKEKFECSPLEDLVFDIPETENNAIENERTENNSTADDTVKEQTVVNIKTRSGRTVKRPERFKDYV